MSSHWPMIALGEVLTERREVPAAEDLLSGRVRIVEKISFDSGRLQLRADGATKTGMVLVLPGDLLVSGINAAKGAIAIYDETATSPIAATIHYGAYVPDPSRVSVKYLWWLLRSELFRDLLREHVPGGIKTELKAKRLLRVPVPLPPLEEQRRIVAAIQQFAEQLDQARSVRDSALRETQAIVAAHLVRVFAEGIAMGWTPRVLGDYVTDVRYGTSEKTTDDSSGTPILRMGNIQDGRLDLSNLRFLHLGSSDRARLMLMPGDLLVNRTNSAALVGKCAVFDAPEEFSFASYLIRLRLDSRRADPHLVAAYINSPLGRDYMVSEKRQMTGQANVNATTLRAMPIALPKLGEQKRIVNDLRALSTEVELLVHRQRDVSADLDTVLAAILDLLLRAQLP